MKYTIQHDKENGWFVIYNKNNKAVDAQPTKDLAHFLIEHILNKGQQS